MVTVSAYKACVNKKGEPFFALVLQGDITFMRSATTGNYYATAWKGSLSTTFNEEFCKSLVGRKLPGIIEKVECDPYEYTVQSTGEVLTLTHRYRFNPSPNSPSMEETVFTPEMATA